MDASLRWHDELELNRPSADCALNGETA